MLHRAGKRFVEHLVPDGTKLGIVTFAKEAHLVQTLTEINNGTRPTLAKKFSFSLEGWTYINKGVRMALDELKKSGKTKGSAIVLITDGNDQGSKEGGPKRKDAAEGDPDMDTVVSQLKESEVRLDCIGVGDEADKHLETWAKDTGGKMYYINSDDDVANTQFEMAFSSAVEEQYDSEERPASIMNQDTRNITGTSQTWIVPIDPELGHNTLFFLSSASMESLNITIESPSGMVFDKTSPSVRKTKNDFVLKLEDSETGDWKVTATSPTPDVKSITFNVKSAPRDIEIQPIRVYPWLSDVKIEFPKPEKIFVEVKKDYYAVLNLDVKALVEANGTKTALDLRDDGVGADLVANDGIYCGFYSEYKGDGRYMVKAKVESTSDTKFRIPTKKCLGLKPLSRTGECTNNAIHPVRYSSSSSSRRGRSKVRSLNMPVYELDDPDMFQVTSEPPPNFDLLGYSLQPLNRAFMRQVDVGVFELTNYHPKGRMLPGEVSNLKSSIHPQTKKETMTRGLCKDCDYLMELEWTAVGAKAMSGVASSIEVRLSDQADLTEDMENFRQGVLVTQDMVVKGSLTNPKPPGQRERLVIRVPVDLLETALDTSGVIFAGVITLDEEGNPGPISNTAPLPIATLDTED